MVESDAPRRRTRRELDALADGSSGDTPLDEFVGEMRSMGLGMGVTPDRRLTEFVSAPPRPAAAAASYTADHSKGTPLMTALTAIAGTTTGKVLLVASAAAAALSGIAVADIITGEPDSAEIAAASADVSSPTGASVPPSSDSGGLAPSSSPSDSSLPSSGATIPTVPGASSVPDDSAVAGPTDLSLPNSSGSGWLSEGAPPPTSPGGDSSSDSVPSSTPGPAPSAPTPSAPGATTQSNSAPSDQPATTFDAAGAGSGAYAIQGGRLVLLGAQAAPGWVLIDESSAAEIDLSFRAVGGTARVDVDIEFDDGAPRVRVRRENSEDDRFEDDQRDERSGEKDDRDDDRSDHDDDSAGRADLDFDEDREDADDSDKD